MAYKVLVVDDSAIMRNEISKIINEDPELEVVGSAINGKYALDKVKILDPDVVTMDINMPIMDGIEALKQIMATLPRPVIMISTLTVEGAEETIEALALGAYDYLPKPGGDRSSIRAQAELIKAKVLEAAHAKERGVSKKLQIRRPTPPKSFTPRPKATLPSSGGNVIVGIGVSTGGPKNLLAILPEIPADFPGSILIAQHMPKAFTPTFATRLNNICPMNVKEAAEGDILEKGWIYIAPGGCHMEITSRGRINQVKILDDESQPYKPSVHLLFKSLSVAFSNKWIGVMLTGMGADGAQALTDLRKDGGRTIAESEESCVVFGMPGKVVALGGAEFILDEKEIATKIISLAGG
ncbi:MAG: chemotaxis response regulator protein-glutamate methylesterase [SAR324 cluster bacterium]|nr:chemotaxis response regulator protein-glutamate methylesterase [SAR324 cluster bacterium]